MKFYEFASLLARGEVPGEIMDILRMERTTALSKPDGGVRGITVGDILRRLVSRTAAQQYSKRVEIATAPFQYALSTRVGCECIAHVVQTLTGIDEEATVVFIDGVEAFDFISRNAMLQALEIDGGDQIMPFVRQLYGPPSTHMWENEMGEVHDIAQGEGGEQGDPLMPLLFSLGQHARLQDGERLFAYLDDIYAICHHVESWKCTVFCKRSCGLMHASGFTTVRSNSGTGVGLSRPGLRSSPLQLVWNLTQWC